MRRYWYRRILIMVLVFTVSVGGCYYFIQYQKKEMNREVNADASEEMVIPGGMPVGIYLETDGVLILGTEEIKNKDGVSCEPAAYLVKEGDYIVSINEEEVASKKELIEAVGQLSDEKVILKVRRKEKLIDIQIEAVEYEEDNYKLGIWVKDNAQGLGTITYLRPDSTFGALGHGIHDADTNELLEIDRGVLYQTSIKDIQKGATGLPGGMEGIIVYNNYNVLGSIADNTSNGIFGKLERIDTLFMNTDPMEIADIEEVKEGKASIRCSVEGQVEEYDIEIKRVNLNARDANKMLEIKIVDEELLKLTGGIVQGMSGSPIIQDGKLVGAVTHVLVNDPTRGYGIFIENMLEAAG